METINLEIAKEIIKGDYLNLISTRVGIIFLTVILVKILVSFYKYNVKLAAFYESRRHALVLSGLEDLKRVKVFASVMSIEKIDFEKDESESNVAAAVNSLMTQ
jgi:hypothetical protein